jgi:hypothetical protein
MKSLKINKQHAFNAQKGRLKNRVSPFPYDKSFSGKLIPLSQWCEQNFYSLDQGYRFLKIKRLLGVKQRGVWYVRENPNYCFETEKCY